MSTNYLHILHPLSNENGVTCTQNVQVKDENGVTCAQNVQANNLTCTQNVQVTCTQNVQVGCTQNVQVQYNKTEYNKTENNKNNCNDDARESQNLETLLRIAQDKNTEMARKRSIISKEWKMFCDLRRDCNYIQELATQYNQPIIKIKFEVERWFQELYMSQEIHPNQERFLQHFLVWLKDDIKTIDDYILFLKKL